MDYDNAPARAEKPAKHVWLDVREASEFCGLTVATLAQYRQLRKKGLSRGPAFQRVQGSIFYSQAECEAWLQRRRAGK
ncbi:helix-turn-helix domain-containing protein [Albimonas pacifica]|uniref:Helix-turn-helix domain-containing protein n=1 Tax=Albimonas pacifica TaxID=1114924 RepID=A0A1I3M144_9RHOB|nr:helix-turn-helix domain-containing protein [Albimonas pacifica]SFI90739.1 hypothetical protein SAMN05216258_110267 [Albimonas pacifica]